MNSKTTTKPWKQGQPYIMGAADEAKSVYNDQKGNIAGIASSVQGMLPGLMEKFNAGNPALNAAQGYAADVIGGKYLDGNPHLQGMIDQTANDVSMRVNNAIGARGRTGGDTHASYMSRELANAENGLRYQNYGTEMARRDSMAGLSPTLSQAEYAPVNTILAAAGAGAELPFAASNNYADQIARILGNYTTTKQSGGAGQALAGLGGAALSGWASGGF